MVIQTNEKEFKEEQGITEKLERGELDLSEKLTLGNDDPERCKNNIYNRFYGSLEPLRGMTKLPGLCIDGTDVEEGLEYLPTTIEKGDFKRMSSAQIANMFNEATILTVRYQQKAISQAILLEAFDRVLMGPALKSQALTPETKKLVAYHEAGHAVVVDLREKEDDTLVNKREILAQIMSFLGGRISEELVFGTSYVTTGNYSDYKRVSELARDLILRYSMSDLGIIASQDSPFFGEESLNELSEAARQKFEDER
ncbi:4286_t:CDS:2 [Entrophospora sp. SA101]|nr:4286_t:CDS:2 [Entrophospora sp. SA101]